MSTKSQQPVQRGRASSSDAPTYQDPEEELAEVANLVERRRVQNRISQRNYRTKIRNRLEKLEAMVDANRAKEANRAGPPSSSPPPNLTTPRPSTTTTDPSRPRERASSHASQVQRQQLKLPQESESCQCVSDFFNLTSTDIDAMCHCPHMQAMNPLTGQDDRLGSLSYFVDPDGCHDTINLPLATPMPTQQGPLTPSNHSNSPGSTAFNNDNTNGSSLDVRPPLVLNPQAFSQYGYPFPIAMGIPMVPMGLFAWPNPTIQDGWPWSAASGPRPAMPQGPASMPQCVWMPMNVSLQTAHTQDSSSSDSSSVDINPSAAGGSM